MKTMTIISALSLALFFTGVNAGFSKPTNKDGNAGPNNAINVKYQVTVNIQVIKNLCNTYEVEIVDANGRLVAPAQTYVPGIEKYNFVEQTRQTAGIRIAKMIVVYRGEGDHFICEQELSTPPVARLINFTDSQLFTFDLYPTTGNPK
jgi:hypothetical protein